MKKHLKKLMCVATVLCATGLQAQTAIVPCVVVETTDSRTEYLLSTAPRIKCSDEVVTLTTTEATIELPVSEVAKVYLAETTITPVNTCRQTARVKLAGDRLTLSGLTPASQTCLYDSGGRMLVSQRADQEGKAELTLPNKHHGVLLVSTNQQTFKLIRK